MNATLVARPSPASTPAPAQPERLISVTFAPHSTEHLAWLAQIEQRFNSAPQSLPSQRPEPIKKAA